MTRRTITIKYQSPEARPVERSDLCAVLARQPISLALMCAIAFGIGFMMLALGMG